MIRSGMKSLEKKSFTFFCVIEVKNKFDLPYEKYMT
jgi:hypothetical protein